MRGNLMLWIDQYGRHIYARSIKELREKAGGGRVSKMYCDGNPAGKHAGKTFETGRVVGRYWFNGFVPFEVTP